MKPFLLALLAALAAAPLASDDPEEPLPPMPIDCPLCGGDPSVHVRVLTSLAVFQARVALRTFDAIF